jgi:putative ABC transport system permease protein
MSSYLKFLSRNKLYSIIEAVGLAVSLAFVIIIGSYAWQQYSITRESPDGKDIYTFGMPDYLGLTWAFADEITDRIPEVEMTVRYCEGIASAVAIGDEKINVEVNAVGKDFFTMFPHIRFVEGGPEGIESLSNIIVSESFARKYDLKLGQTIKNALNNEYVITGILASDQKTVFKFPELIVNERDPMNWGSHEDPYDHFGTAITFAKFAKGTDPQVIYDKVDAVCKEIYPNMYGRTFFEKLDVTRFDHLYFKEYSGPNSQTLHGDFDTLKLLALVGLLLLLSAVFNYINLSFALTEKRAKEMATRRLLGAQKWEITWKYIAESLVFTAACFGLGLLLAYAFAPSMNALLNDPDIPITIQMKPQYLFAYLAVIVVVGILNGIIPAWFASRVEPMDVVKGTFKRNTKMVFNKMFIVVQNALAIFLITMALVMEVQYHRSMNRPMHCNTKDLFYLDVIGFNATREALSDALEQLPCVKRMGACKGVPGWPGYSQYSQTRDGQEIAYRVFQMDTLSFQMLGFEKVSDYCTPVFNSVWYGERAFAATGFDDDYHDISQTLSQKNPNFEQVAGVIRDFPVSRSNSGVEEYTIVNIRKPEDISWGGGSVNFAGFLIETSGSQKEARKAIREVVEKWGKGTNYWVSANDYIDNFYREALKPAKNNMRLLEVFMLLAVLISLLGLIAMSTYYAGENAHSIAVRKVFGGTVESETRRTVGEYMLLVLIGAVIAVPLAIWAAQRYLEQFIVKLHNYAWIFVVAVLLAFVMAFLSVLWQTLRAARTNPSEALKKE